MIGDAAGTSQTGSFDVGATGAVRRAWVCEWLPINAFLVNLDLPAAGGPQVPINARAPIVRPPASQRIASRIAERSQQHTEKEQVCPASR